MTKLRRVNVFCGSRPGARPAYAEAARAFGRALAARGVGLVYGGASGGLMGEIASAVIAAGGESIGILPRALLEREPPNRDLTKLEIVSSMHERKARMAALSDAFVALPGGFGTFDELFEAITYVQIGEIEKPIGLLDTAGYFRPTLAMIQHAVDEGLAPAELAKAIVVSTEPEALVDAMIAEAERAKR